MKEKLKDRFLILSLCFVAFGLIITFRLIDLQVVHGAEFDALSQRRVYKESPIAAPRGKVFDRLGVPIAVNRQGFTVQFVKSGITTDELNATLLRLYNVFEKNHVNFQDNLSQYLTYNPITFGEKSWEQIKKWQKHKDRLNIEDDEKLMKEPGAVFDFLREKFKISKDYSDADAYKIMTLRYEILIDNWNYVMGGTILLARDVDMKVIAEIEERHHEFPGVITDVEPLRTYMNASDSAHVLGYVRQINPEQLEEMKEEGYEQGDLIGQAGVEKAAERYLRGKDGKKKIAVDTNGRLIEELDSIPAIPGSDVILTIDTNLQRVAMESLKRNIELIRQGKVGNPRNNLLDANAGAVVAIDVNTGEVLASASYPSYSPDIFLKGKEDKEAQAAIKALYDENNEDKPSYNRAIQGIYAPGSTFKPLVAIAALEEGIITPNRTIFDSGKLNIGGWDFSCLEYKMGMGAHGHLDLKRALETSCNIYFHEIGYETGIDDLEKWAKYFGLGVKTGIDIPGEYTGIMSSKAFKKERYDDVWRPADTAQVGIGQLYNNFTPLQLATYVATIANGGKRFTPFVIKKVIKYDGSIVNETKPDFVKVPVKPATIAAVKEGMVAVTQSVEGTAKNAFKDFPFQVAGKTGTAQTGKEAKHSSNALFVCYAPADNPKIAIAVVVERGAWGSNTAPIARDILDEYFGLNKTKTVDDSLKPDEPVFTP